MLSFSAELQVHQTRHIAAKKESRGYLPQTLRDSQLAGDGALDEILKGYWDNGLKSELFPPI